MPPTILEPLDLLQFIAADLQNADLGFWRDIIPRSL